MIASAVPNFIKVIVLVGSLATPMIAFILPAGAHLKLFGNGSSVLRNIFHVIMILIGLLAMASGLYTVITGN